jgi:hypothetical protein
MHSAILTLSTLALVAFVQNMFFTMVSRSRSSGDVNYHRKCAWGSNGIWFICQVLIVKEIWTAINNGQWWFVLIAGAVYTVFTTEGSVVMMRHLLKTEEGNRRVGARATTDWLVVLKYPESMTDGNSEIYSAQITASNEAEAFQMAKKEITANGWDYANDMIPLAAHELR